MHVAPAFCVKVTVEQEDVGGECDRERNPTEEDKKCLEFKTLPSHLDAIE